MTAEIVAAGYAAVIAGSGGRLMCFGFGETREAAYAAASHQMSGATRSARAAMMRRTYLRPVDADQASELIEMLSSPALRWAGEARV